MQYRGRQQPGTLGDSGNMVDMMAHVLAAPTQEHPENLTSYCSRGLDYLERDCEDCALVNYGRDCHNNPIT